MSTTDQLQWEARLARPAAFAAFAAGVLLLAGTVIFQTILDDRPQTRGLPDFLLSVDQSPGSLIAAASLQALAALGLILVFYYLFRATSHRTAGLPRFFVYFIVLGPAMYAVSQLIGAFDRVDVAHTFAERASNLEECPAIRFQAGEDCAQALVRENPNALSVALSLAGSVSVAFLFVMLPLRARRAGLLSPFMGILGVIAGALLVLQLVPLVPVIVQAFWLGAIGALFLGRWPGGRGPAWETGEADPWPTPAQRRGLVAPRGGGADADEAPPEPEPEPVPERPSSRKRKRKRR